MRNSACTQKGSFLLLKKLYKANFYLYQQQSSLRYEAPCISNIARGRNKVSIAIKCSVLPTDD